MLENDKKVDLTLRTYLENDKKVDLTLRILRIVKKRGDDLHHPPQK